MQIVVEGHEDEHRVACRHTRRVVVDLRELRPLGRIVVDVRRVGHCRHVDRAGADAGRAAARGIRHGIARLATGREVKADERGIDHAADLDHVRAGPDVDGAPVKGGDRRSVLDVVVGVGVRAVDDVDSGQGRVGVRVIQNRLGHEESARAGHPDGLGHRVDAVAHRALGVGDVRLALVDPGARVEDREDSEHGQGEKKHDDDHLDEREPVRGSRATTSRGASWTGASVIGFGTGSFGERVGDERR